MPGADAPPAAWARWYRDACGWLVFPVRCDEDVEGLTAWLLRRRRVEYVDAHGEQPPAEWYGDAIRLSREEAEARRKSPMVPWSERTSVTNDDIAAWWGGDLGAKRPIWVAMGRRDVGSSARAGLEVIAVDVDPRSGGSVEEWEGIGGPLAHTPSGGIHVLTRPHPGLMCSEGAVAPGVDVRASGGGIVVPSGLATPGRSWGRWEAPQPCPERVAQARPYDRRREPTDGPSGIDGSTRPASTFAEILGTPAPDGTRNASAKAIVGVLARPQAIPEDALEPALSLLKESGEEDLDTWRSLLTRGPRDAETAVAFLTAWSKVCGDPPWSDGKAERVARSLWKTADRREGGNAGAEDLGVGEWGGVPAYATEGEGDRGGEEEAPREVGNDDGDRGSGDGQVDGPADPGVVQAKRRSLTVPEGFCSPLSVTFPAERFVEMTKVIPISIANGPKWRRPNGDADTSAEFGYGLGKWLEDDIGGGLNPGGTFIAIGARKAKSGKTNLLGQLVEGLVLASARRLMKKEDGWITPVFWLTEMMPHADVSVRMIGRYLGADTSMWSRGVNGHEAPGILDMAIKMGVTREKAAEHIVNVTTALCNSYNEFSVARSLTVNFDTGMLPRKRGGRNTMDPRLGIALLDVADVAIEQFCDDLARKYKIDRERIKPIMITDPIHRFADMGGEDRLTAINLITHRMREFAYQRHRPVFATSDTTKAGAAADKSMEGDPGIIAGDAFAGTNNLTHEPDTVIVIHPEEDMHPGGSVVAVRNVLVRVCYCRRGTRGLVLPFKWYPHNGRYLAQDPTIQSDGIPVEQHASPPVKRKRGRPKGSKNKAT